MEEQELLRVKSARRISSRLGWGLVLMLLISPLLSLLLVPLLRALEESGVEVTPENPLVLWMLAFLPNYGVALPLCIGLLHKIPPEPLCPPTRLPLRGFLKALLMCAPVVLLGSWLGNLLPQLLFGDLAQNRVIEVVVHQNWLNLLTLLVLAPVMEELLFRKMLLDRCSRYGEKAAVVLSALTFGMFHCNLYQLFYTVGIGLLLAYVYVRTRNMWYCVFLHALVNLFGGVIPPFLVSRIDEGTMIAIQQGTLTEAEQMAALPQVMPVYLYQIFMMVMALWGLLVLKRNWGKAYFAPAPDELLRKQKLGALFGTGGMLIFLILSAVASVITLF